MREYLCSSAIFHNKNNEEIKKISEVQEIMKKKLAHLLIACSILFVVATPSFTVNADNTIPQDRIMQLSNHGVGT